MSIDQHNPFPFTNLPVELRLMIYERLPRQIKHTVVSIDGEVAVLVTRHLPTAILRASKQIYLEAHAIAHLKRETLAYPKGLAAAKRRTPAGRGRMGFSLAPRA